MAARISSPPKAAETPIPALAPVDKPVEDGAAEAPVDVAFGADDDVVKAVEDAATNVPEAVGDGADNVDADVDGASAARTRKPGLDISGLSGSYVKFSGLNRRTYLASAAV